MAATITPERTYPYTAFVVLPSLTLRQVEIVKKCGLHADMDKKDRVFHVSDLHRDPKDAVVQAQQRLADFEADLNARKITHAKRVEGLAKSEKTYGVTPRLPAPPKAAA